MRNNGILEKFCRRIGAPEHPGQQGIITQVAFSGCDTIPSISGKGKRLRSSVSACVRDGRESVGAKAVGFRACKLGDSR